MKFESLTPNLIVSDMAASVAFYRDVLGFTISESVPEAPPYVFAWMKRDDVNVFLNDAKPVVEQFPTLTIGRTSVLFIVVDAVDELFQSVAPRAQVVMPLTDQFYGMREFAVLDPDGYLITLAQRIAR
jgi:uncharacterized glyoxalase superfamily protein PhnB